MSNELKPLHFDADYTMEEALAEAKRCLNCPKPLCRMGCPIENEIPRFIQAIARGNFGEANDILAERTNLPSICGRVCPRENQCEGNCIMNKAKKPPINIGKLERFAADFESINELRKPKKIQQNLGNVAVVGSGPAGLSVAGDMAKLGYNVTVFEGQSEPGGVLLFGIPEFRLSKSVVRREIARLEGLGVKFVCNIFIGQDKTLDDLFAEGFDSIFIGTGTHIPQEVRMENDEVHGVFQAMYLLTNVQLVENGDLDESLIPVKKGDRVIIIGGGNVAIDVARDSKRCASDDTKVNMYCLESRETMPASVEEIEEAESEGIVVNPGWGPKEVLVDENGEVRGIVLKKCISVKDADGRFNPQYDENQLLTVECKHVFFSVGQAIVWGDLLKGSKVELGRGNGAVADALTYQTAEPDIFVGGDVYTGPKFAIDAIAAGKQGAISIHRFVQPHSSLTIGRNRNDFIELNKNDIKVENYDNSSRQIPGHNDSIDTKHSFRDAKLVFTEEQVKAETARCLGCGASVVDQNKCIGCGICTTKCEFDAIKLHRELPGCSKMVPSEDKLKYILPNGAKQAIKIKFSKKK